VERRAPPPGAGIEETSNMSRNPLVRLEKGLVGLITKKLGGPGTEPVELVPRILEAVEEKIRPTPEGGRTFPYDRVRVTIHVARGERGAARAAFEHPVGLDQRIHEHLREAGCTVADDLAIETRFVPTRPEAWGEAPFLIEYRVTKARKQAAPAPAALPRVTLEVREGEAPAGPHVFDLERIAIGRSRLVEDGNGPVRHNHLAFDDVRTGVNGSVSRVHAHIRCDAARRTCRLFDDGSAAGTRVLRRGRYLVVPRQGSQGVKLEDGDEILFGRARVGFSMREGGAS
jgi:hypothetical protein